MNFQKNGWILAGLLFGASMFVLVSLGTSLLLRGEITWIDFAVGIPIWTITGLLWANYMKKSLMKQALKKQKSEVGKTS
ncbi:MAG: hypothetical protein CVV25_12770 [Ignavibacteriae bacterium HGW-Ignavibacteriae-4]|jgi:hypothetical protein|nr:MAG: hypothetical protein CVV25_12770 [Ignavibacteriae bacterium HGW-Ignavibacteriae-4]